MARPITIGETILDYVDTLIQFHEVERRPLSGIALNQFEWVQFINCVNMNHADCQTVAELDEKKPACGKYKGVYLYWDGTENNNDEFIFHMHDLRGRMEDTRRRNTRPEEAANDVAMDMPTPRLRGSNQVYGTQAGMIRPDPHMYINRARFAEPEEAPRQAGAVTARVNF